MIWFYDISAYTAIFSLVIHIQDTSSDLTTCDIVDPCTTANASTAFEIYARYENCQYDSAYSLCDRYLTTTWYNFNEDIIDHCPGLLSCGAIYPLWLNGSLPSSSDGVVVRKVCKVGFQNCCDKEYDIKIKNCGTFNAYCLSALDGCPERYCFGSNGTCEYPTTTSSPITSGPVQSNLNCFLDPCVESNVNSLDEPYERSENCIYRSDSTTCDRYLDKKWYKVDSPILNHCPNLLSCGTLYPVWMNDSLPSLAEGSVTKTACKRGFNDCCIKTYNIQVKNCGTYVAYCLEELDGCPERYCFGENDSCAYVSPSAELSEDTPIKVEYIVLIVLACAIALYVGSEVFGFVILYGYVKWKHINSVGSKERLQNSARNGTFKDQGFMKQLKRVYESSNSYDFRQKTNISQTNVPDVNFTIH